MSQTFPAKGPPNTDASSLPQFHLELLLFPSSHICLPKLPLSHLISRSSTMADCYCCVVVCCILFWYSILVLVVDRCMIKYDGLRSFHDCEQQATLWNDLDNNQNMLLYKIQKRTPHITLGIITAVLGMNWHQLLICGLNCIEPRDFTDYSTDFPFLKVKKVKSFERGKNFLQ